MKVVMNDAILQQKKKKKKAYSVLCVDANLLRMIIFH